MSERVSVIKGKEPIILVCPHGPDDTNTAIITETAAKKLNCSAVINRGFEKSAHVDVLKDLANCNRIDHAKEPVVFDEFLNPILKQKSKLIQKLNATRYDVLNPIDYSCTIFHIHGCGNQVHNEAGENVGLIVGCGLGEKRHSITCREWRTNCFIDSYSKYAMGNVYIGIGGGKYAGRDSNNMNQYFRKHDIDDTIDSLQLEFPLNTRNYVMDAERTGTQLTYAIDELMRHVRHPTKNALRFI